MGYSVEVLAILAALNKLSSDFRGDKQIAHSEFLIATEGLIRTYFSVDGGAHFEMASENRTGL